MLGITYVSSHWQIFSVWDLFKWKCRQMFLRLFALSQLHVAVLWKEIQCTSRFTVVTCQSVSCSVCPHVSRLLISVFFLSSVFLWTAACHHITNSREKWPWVFLVLGERKEAFFFLLSCHRIKHKVLEVQMHANMKWQRLDWTIEWLSKASQLSSQFSVWKSWYFDSTVLLVYMKFKWRRNNNNKKNNFLASWHSHRYLCFKTVHSPTLSSTHTSKLPNASNQSHLPYSSLMFC